MTPEYRQVATENQALGKFEWGRKLSTPEPRQQDAYVKKTQSQMTLCSDLLTMITLLDISCERYK